MGIIKKILITLGSVFVLIIVLAIYLAGASSSFKDQHEQFIRDFTRDFSQQWDISSISHHTTNELLSNINTPNGQHALAVFRSLGKLVDITDLEIQNYNSSMGGATTGTFTFKARFEHASALVTVILQAQDDRVKIHGFHIDPIGDIDRPKEIRT